MPIAVIDNQITDADVRIIKKTTTPSLSGKSTLTYHIAATPESNILIRLDKSSGSGKFSRAWLSLDNILRQIQSQKEPFTWSVLSPLFKAQSVNTSGFLLAVLKSEGLVRSVEQGYETVDPVEIKKVIKSLTGKKGKVRKTRTTCKRSAA